MTLAAAQVRDAIAARLVPTATLVTTKRLHPLTEAHLPAWRVRLVGDDTDPGLGLGVQTHRTTIEAAGIVRAVDDVDDALDTLLAAGLTAVHAVQAANFSVVDGGTAWPLPPADGEAATAQVVHRFVCTYATDPAAPEVLL